MSTTDASGDKVTFAALAAGLALGTAAVALLRAPLWGGILVGAAAALGTKVAIDKASTA